MVAAAYPAMVRLLVALAGMIAFIGLVTTRGRRALPVGPVVVLGLIVVGWLFGATLVWGTESATQVRVSAAWTTDGFAWQWTALLLVALAGVESLALALRSFAQARPGLGWSLAAIGGAAFAGWSVVVRYPVPVAVLAFGAGACALLFIGARASASSSDTTAPTRRRRAVPVVLAALVIGCAWSALAFVWLVAGREGHAPCGCWGDLWGTWQYTVQLSVALAGGLSLVAVAISYAMGSKRVIWVTGWTLAAAGGTWILFAITGALL